MGFSEKKNISFNRMCFMFVNQKRLPKTLENGCGNHVCYKWEKYSKEI